MQQKISELLKKKTFSFKSGYVVKFIYRIVVGLMLISMHEIIKFNFSI